MCDSVTVEAAPDSWVSTRCTVSRSPAPACTAATGPSAGTSTDSACGPMSHSAPCSLRHGEESNGDPASEESHDPAPPASRVRAGLGQPGRRRRLEPEGEEHDRGDPGVAHRVDHPVRAGDVERDRLLQQQVLAGGRGPFGERGLHVRRQRDRDGVHLGQQLVDVAEAGDVELRAEGLGLAEVPAPDADELGGGVRGERRGVDLLGPEAGAEHPEPHAQTAPN